VRGARSPGSELEVRRGDGSDDVAGRQERPARDGGPPQLEVRGDELSARDRHRPAAAGHAAREGHAAGARALQSERP